MELLLVAMALQVLAGLTAAIAGKRPGAATAFGCGGAVAAGLLGLAPALRVLAGGSPESLCLAWDGSHGHFIVELDALTAFFLVPVLVMSALAAIYGAGYMFAYRCDKLLGAHWFFFNVFVAGMVMVVIARTALLFLVAWEVMSIAAFCLVTFEHEKADVRRAGWVYLIATHLGAAFLFFAFLLLGRNAGSLDFEAFRDMPVIGGGWSGLIFLLALIGFGAKAGFVPFHVWLPEAHPAAPSHISALMSGVMIKMGLYGILRITTFLAPPAPWWGVVLAGIGLLTGLVGVALALQQRDMKCVLAYSSIENMGLIGLALGIALWGKASGFTAIAALGMTAALMHTWNHSLMKGLMFFSAGSVLHATGTKDMEKQGGLLKRMPWTGSAMMAGAVAMAALPPLNGFAGKWLMYLSLMRCGLSSSDGLTLTALLSVGLLVLIGAAAALTFARLTGIVLLGSPRSDSAGHARESSPWLVAPMLILAVLCLGSAVAPRAVAGWVAAPLEQVLGSDAGRPLAELDSVAPLLVIGVVNACLLAGVVSAGLGLSILLRRGGRQEGSTWGCGYARPTPRMQYTGRSFAEMTTERLLPRSLQPHSIAHRPEGLFPSKSDFGSECPDPVYTRVYGPLFKRWAERFSRLRILQQGLLHIYLVYVVLTVVLALAWLPLRTWWAGP